MSVKRLLATDLDGTLIGDDDAMLSLWDDLRRDDDLLIAFSTGRHLQSIRDFYTEKRLPDQADACICMVGTNIYHRRDQNLNEADYSIDPRWHKRIADGWDANAVRACIAEWDDAEPQPDEWQSPYKCSYFVDNASTERIETLRRKLTERGVQAKVVYSADRFLDVLPASSGKGEAVRYLAAHHNIPADCVLTCGDTGNDLDMMRPELGFLSVAVGNAAPELKQLRHARVYHATASFAAGIREGLQHYNWL